MSRRVWWLVGGAAGLVLIAAAGVWIWQAGMRPATAEEAALDYLRALESGDPGRVEATGVLMPQSALDAFAAADAFVEDAAVTAVTSDDSAPVGGASATAEVSFRLDGEKHTAQLTLSPVDGRWVVDDSGWGTVTATASAGSFVEIGDQSAPTGEETALLPATYMVTAAPASLLRGESSVSVLPGAAASLDIEVALRPEATVAAQKQLDDHIEACTAPRKTPPAGCGIRLPWGTEFRTVSEVRYRVEQVPAIALAADTFTAEGGVLVATVDGTGQDGAARTTTYRTASWSLRGTASFTATDVVLAPW